MTGLVAAVRCNFCSRALPAWRTHRFGTDARPAQRICDDCLDWHIRALDLLAGRSIPLACQGCGKEISHADPATVEKRYVVPRDGVYQVLCGECVLPYAGKRRDLYGNTAFGAALKL